MVYFVAYSETARKTQSETKSWAPTASVLECQTRRIGSHSFRIPAENTRGRRQRWTVTGLRFAVLFFHRNGLQFEMPTPQQRSRSDEFSRRVVLGREITLVNGIELLKK
jgi:hypothetical protein